VIATLPLKRFKRVKQTQTYAGSGAPSLSPNTKGMGELSNADARESGKWVSDHHLKVRKRRNDT